MWAMYQGILNIPLWNDWGKVTYSQAHSSAVFKAFLFEKFQCICATIFAALI